MSLRLIIFIILFATLAPLSYAKDLGIMVNTGTTTQDVVVNTNDLFKKQSEVVSTLLSGEYYSTTIYTKKTPNSPMKRAMLMEGLEPLTIDIITQQRITELLGYRPAQYVLRLNEDYGRAGKVSVQIKKVKYEGTRNSNTEQKPDNIHKMTFTGMFNDGKGKNRTAYLDYYDIFSDKYTHVGFKKLRGLFESMTIIADFKSKGRKQIAEITNENEQIEVTELHRRIQALGLGEPDGFHFYINKYTNVRGEGLAVVSFDRNNPRPLDAFEYPTPKKASTVSETYKNISNNGKGENISVSIPAKELLQSGNEISFRMKSGSFKYIMIQIALKSGKKRPVWRVDQAGSTVPVDKLINALGKTKKSDVTDVIFSINGMNAKYEPEAASADIIISGTSSAKESLLPYDLISAGYGANGSYCNAYPTVRKNCYKKDKCTVQSNNYLCGDPAEGKEKELIVTYKCKSKIQFASAKEGLSALIICK